MIQIFLICHLFRSQTVEIIVRTSFNSPLTIWIVIMFQNMALWPELVTCIFVYGLISTLNIYALSKISNSLLLLFYV